MHIAKISTIVVATGIFVIANLVISKVPLRMDLSEGKVYTLAPSTKKIISKLDDRVNIKLFISEDLPLRLIPLKNDVVDLVGEYKNLSKGKIDIKIIDPKKNQKALREAQNLGIPELKFSQIEKDKYALSTAYFGITVFYEDKKETISQAMSIDTLEYDLTSSIYKMTQKEPVKIGIIGSPEGEDPRQDELFSIKGILDRQYDLSLNDLDNIGVNSSIKTLVVFDDYKSQYTNKQKNLISKYINNGGKAIFMIDGVYIVDGLTVQPAAHNLFDFFEKYGILLNKDLVLSKSSEFANFTTGETSFFTQYPFWIKTANFPQRSLAVSNVQVLTFPWVSSLGQKKDNKELNILVKAEKNSWLMRENFILAPDKIVDPKEEEIHEAVLIVEKNLPKGGKIALIPSSRFVKEQFLSADSDNASFILNLINDYASGGALSGIRARAVSISPLKDYDTNTKETIKYLSIFALPALYALIGLFSIFRKR